MLTHPNSQLTDLPDKLFADGAKGGLGKKGGCELMALHHMNLGLLYGPTAVMQGEEALTSITFALAFCICSAHIQLHQTPWHRNAVQLVGAKRLRCTFLTLLKQQTFLFLIFHVKLSSLFLFPIIFDNAWCYLYLHYSVFHIYAAFIIFMWKTCIISPHSVILNRHENIHVMFSELKVNAYTEKGCVSFSKDSF